jgi:3-oxoacyl-[acyl-carrier-protein] synthase II
VRRVVVTGLGALTPVGLDVDQSWAAICAGRSGGGPITRFDCAGWPVAIAAELKGFDSLLASGDRRMEKRLEPFTQYALVAAEQALQDAGLSGPLGDRAGVYVGSGIGGVGEITSGALKLEKEGWRGVSPFLIPRSLINLAAGQIAMRWGARGPSLAVATACATGNHSIGEAWRAIRYGEADVAIAGGAEAAIVPLGMAGFMVMKALSKRNADPSTASRPFDIDRDGFVMGEGAGVVILEERERALARGARIYAELAGYALTNDAHHITAPPPGHEGAARTSSGSLAGVDVPWALM